MAVRAEESDTNRSLWRRMEFRSQDCAFQTIDRNHGLGWFVGDGRVGEASGKTNTLGSQ